MKLLAIFAMAAAAAAFVPETSGALAKRDDEADAEEAFDLEDFDKRDAEAEPFKIPFPFPIKPPVPIKPPKIPPKVPKPKPMPRPRPPHRPPKNPPPRREPVKPPRRRNWWF